MGVPPERSDQVPLAGEYGVSHTSIGRDFVALARYVAENLDRDHSFILDWALHGAVRNLVEDGDHYKAFKDAEKWYDWRPDIGEVARTPERRELHMEATVAHQQTETEDYVLITDEGFHTVRPHIKTVKQRLPE